MANDSFVDSVFLVVPVSYESNELQERWIAPALLLPREKVPEEGDLVSFNYTEEDADPDAPRHVVTGRVDTVETLRGFAHGEDGNTVSKFLVLTDMRYNRARLGKVTPACASAIAAVQAVNGLEDEADHVVSKTEILF